VILHFLLEVILLRENNFFGSIYASQLLDNTRPRTLLPTIHNQKKLRDTIDSLLVSTARNSNILSQSLLPPPARKRSKEQRTLGKSHSSVYAQNKIAFSPTKCDLKPLLVSLNIDVNISVKACLCEYKMALKPPLGAGSSMLIKRCVRLISSLFKKMEQNVQAIPPVKYPTCAKSGFFPCGVFGK